MVKINLPKEKKYIIYFMITLITTLAMFTTFNYIDGQSLLAYSVTTWDAIFSGDISSFYALKLENLRNAYQPDSLETPIAMFPAVIWSLPVWLTHTFNGNYDVSGLFCIYWFKLIYIIFTIITAYAGYSIIKFFNTKSNNNDSIIALFFILSSPEILISTMYAGQDEIFYIAFMMLALNSFVKKDNKWFLIWSICSVACCDLMLVPVLALLLISENKLYKIVYKLLLTLVPRLVWALLTIGAPYKSLLEGGDAYEISDIFNIFTIETTTGSASIASLLMVLLFFYAYNIKNKESDDIELKRKAIWFITALTVVMSFIMQNHFYRFCIYTPFFIVLLFISRNEKVNVFLYMISLYLRMFTGGYNSPMNINTEYTASGSWAEKICILVGSKKYDTYDGLNAKILEKLPILESMVPMMNGIVLACILLILYHTYTNKKCELDIPVSRKYSDFMIVSCMSLYLTVFYMLLFK
ncbi:MAG: hypothetical protein K6G87_17975 [Butyrivibrio sp.]|uniref:hypothetical protein n=1 Tax=Butyrivibrio sp. TaxID=28121 RepID=UPI0025D7613E|nr:hypothetical protein [Butyrivibrio sp.]MCR5773113.1 hypothetical protein [Butyrivibrio sp.]